MRKKVLVVLLINQKDYELLFAESGKRGGFLPGFFPGFPRVFPDFLASGFSRYCISFSGATMVGGGGGAGD